MKRIGNSICASVLAVCSALVVGAQPAAKSTTAVPRLVQFSGALTDGGGKPLTGVVGVTFCLYESQTGGAPVWMETQNVQAGGHGEYSALLGSTRNDGIPAEIFTSGQRWLGVQAQGEAEGPRTLMTSVPYSLKAVDAETLGGLPASAFALAGTSAGAANHGTAGAEVMAPGTGSTAGSAKAASGVTPNLTGTGTAHYVSLWTTTTNIGNSGLYQTPAGAVGLGTTTPAAKLEAVATSATGTALLGSATSASGANFGVYGSTASPAGIGVDGNATTGTGVAGVTSGPAGYGVYGANGATTGTAYAVFGTTASTAGVGMVGVATANSGSTYGVYGSTVSPAGISVYGTATSGTGVAGGTSGSAGYGVYGGNAATTGSAYGVYGTSASTSGVGTLGQATATVGQTYGVYGSTISPAGIGTLGTATAVTGTTYGVYGSVVSPSGIAVYGKTSATTGTTYGVYGSTVSPNGVGVAANSSAGGTAIAATATGGGSAGQFTGNVKITGNLTVTGTVAKGGGSFRIDHPLDPEHKYLYHSFVESPDMMNIYNGVVTLSRHGDAVVKLPDWFDALNRDFRYQLTCIGGFAPVYVASEVSGNQFKIGGGRPGMKVSWQVTGIRKDAFANDHRIPVEESKE